MEASGQLHDLGNLGPERSPSLPVGYEARIDPWAGFDVLEKRKIYCFYLESNLKSVANNITQGVQCENWSSNGDIQDTLL